MGGESPAGPLWHKYTEGDASPLWFELRINRFFSLGLIVNGALNYCGHDHRAEEVRVPHDQGDH